MKKLCAKIAEMTGLVLEATSRSPLRKVDHHLLLRFFEGLRHEPGCSGQSQMPAHSHCKVLAA
jgi:hypothetical protein